MENTNCKCAYDCMSENKTIYLDGDVQFFKMNKNQSILKDEINNLVIDVAYGLTISKSKSNFIEVEASCDVVAENGVMDYNFRVCKDGDTLKVNSNVLKCNIRDFINVEIKLPEVAFNEVIIRQKSGDLSIISSFEAERLAIRNEDGIITNCATAKELSITSKNGSVNLDMDKTKRIEKLFIRVDSGDIVGKINSNKATLLNFGDGVDVKVYGGANTNLLVQATNGHAYLRYKDFEGVALNTFFGDNPGKYNEKNGEEGQGVLTGSILSKNGFVNINRLF